MTFSDGGQYKCTVGNSMGTVVVTFNVDVQGECERFWHHEEQKFFFLKGFLLLSFCPPPTDDYLEVMIGVPVAVLALIAIVFLVVYFSCYKPKRKGSYTFYDIFFQKVASSA